MWSDRSALRVGFMVYLHLRFVERLGLSSVPIFVIALPIGSTEESQSTIAIVQLIAGVKGP